MHDFSVSEEVALLPFSFYVLGLAFGPMISSPISETFGRRFVYLTSVPVFALFIMGSGFAQSIATLIVCRFFAGLFGSPALSIGSATISEVWIPANRAIPMSLYVATPFLGPALGPLIGGFAVMALGWRWTAWITIFITIAVLAPACVGMRETYKKRILYKRAQRERKARGEANPRTTRGPLLPAIRNYVTTTLVRPFLMLLTEPIPGLFSLYVAFNFAVQYSFYAAFPLVFEESYGFNIGSTGLTFLGLGVGVVIATVALAYFNLKVYKPWVIQWKKEHA